MELGVLKRTVNMISRMAIRPARAIAAMALATSIIGCSIQPSRDGIATTTTPSDRTERAPKRTTLGSVTDRAGHSHNLDAELLAGKKIVFVFWQSWCAPCRREAPGLQRAAVANQKALSFYGMVTGSDQDVDEAGVVSFVADTGLTYPQVRDRDATWWNRFAVKGTPTIVVVDKTGVVFQGHRAPEWAAFASTVPISQPIAASEPSTPTADGEHGTVTHGEQKHSEEKQVERKRQLGMMGTSLEITAIGPDAETLDRAIDAAVAEMQRIEDLMTSWRDSPLNTLNDAAGQGPQRVDREIVRLVARAVDIGVLTEGAFDLTFASVGKLWDFKADPPLIPTEQEIREKLAHVDFRHVDIDLENLRIALPTGTRIGLGGIAKGYGVDRAMRVLLDHGVRHGVVNAGGDMKVLGTNFGKAWEVAIKHPRDENRALAVLRLSNTCLVTSGDYERFFLKDGKRYHHIIDPRDGRPATGAISSSVVAQDAAFADALATALCVLGPQRGLAIIEQLPRVEALIVDLEGEVHASSGLAPMVLEAKLSS